MPVPADGLRYVARQPILDLRGRLHGYELLFRGGPELAWLVSHEYADWATGDAIAKAHGLDREQLQHCYREAVVWAESALHFS